jgi:Xaa-Pro aminopeptidase
MNFPREEFEQRYERLRAALKTQGLDGLLVTGEANFNYFTGFIAVHPWVSYSRNLIAILPVDAPPTLVVPAFLAEEAAAQSWISHVVSTTVVGRAPVDALVSVFRQYGLADAKIGAELGYEQRMGLSFLDFEQLKAALPGATFADAAQALWSLRMQKSPAEVACLREACRVTDVAFERLFNELRPGMTERAIAHRMTELLINEGADRVDWIMMTSGQGQYQRTFGIPRERIPAQGDMVWLDVSAIVNGYRADFCRAAIVGGATAEQQELQDLVYQATMAGVSAIGPGIPVSQVVEAVSGVLVSAGLAPLDSGRIGHGLGLQSTEPPDVSLSDATILQPGMVLTVEPAIIREDGIFQVEQNAAVTDQGFELLSHSPHHLRAI